MSVIKPFRGLRPSENLASKIASPPYDVLSSKEARDMVRENPWSFLHIIKPEICLPENIDVHSREVYDEGVKNLKRFVREGAMKQDDKECLYIYRQIMGNHSQIGLVACASVEEYNKNLIKKHELTRPDKEQDRVNHINALNAQAGPVFLTYKARNDIDQIINAYIKNEPEYDFTADDSIQHTFWVVDDETVIKNLQEKFKEIKYLYVADGHHRSAAASRVREMRKSRGDYTGNEEYNYYLTVIFPDNQMQILDYNRVITDLNGLSEKDFLDKVKDKFNFRELGDSAEKPQARHTYVMYLNKKWYHLEAKSGTYDESDPVGRLDISILMNNLLQPVLGIGDPRTDNRIDFVGGIRGLKELKKRVDSGEMAVAFGLYPISIGDLMAISDNNDIMPPKTTWFEPKLRSGLVVHLLD
ncbi:MAG: DUF1015 family protein [Calditrichaceae bacterium]|jgi:uncharacterized protein (DUF1015 family)